VAQEIAEQRGFFYYSLSKPIHEEAKARKGRRKVPFSLLQDIGNELRRREGPGYLARVALEEAGMALQKNQGEYKGVVLDGVRNVGEIDILRQFPKAFVFAVHAEREIRLKRLREARRVRSDSAFRDADERDAEEGGPFGQQLKRCTYLADVIFNNQEQIAPGNLGQKTQYIRDSVVGRCFDLIGRLASAPEGSEHRPTRQEVLMTLAYTVSKQSPCLQRKVGAVLATDKGQVLSAGHNDVPEGQKACRDDPDIGQCPRQSQQEDFAKRLRYCPWCGTRIQPIHRCAWCKKAVRGYTKVCPHCGRDPSIEWECKCKRKVFRDFLPGAEPSRGKLLDICRSLHAEEKAILNLARTGAVPPGLVLFTTTFPCNLCAKKIAELKVQQVCFAEPYPMDDAKEILEKNGVKPVKFEGVKSSAFFRLFT
jgi:deoxycytidylate deaminase/dephospho-CoA kinase